MIFVRVELRSAISRDRDAVLGEAVIENIGGTRGKGEYRVLLSKRGGFKGRVSERSGQLWRAGFVRGFKRQRSGAPWALLALGLLASIGAERVLSYFAKDGGLAPGIIEEDG